MLERKLYLNTIGCQMNVYDSEQIARVLAPAGFSATHSLEEADLVIVNTCAIRAKAEQKAFSFIGRLAKLKARRPGLVVGVAGCVAQQEGERILSRMPVVDLVFGPHAIGRLPELVSRAYERGHRVVDVGVGSSIQEIDAAERGNDGAGVTRFVTVMQGCDNFCAYCVVPYTRGREMSRHPDRIVEEVRLLAAQGVREVTLLGQNVNSFGRKEGSCSFAELLERVDAVEGIARIRFTTSHPKDLSEELIRAFARLETLCPHIHLPVQSGADRILRRMNRKYDRRTYLDRVARLREACPGIAVTSDFIVGFPGENRKDFEESLSLIEEVAFDGLFAFMYSDRAVAPAAGFDGKVDETEKKARLQELLAAQEVITHRKHRALVGSVQRILLESRNRHSPGVEEGAGPTVAQWSGRTGTNRIVNFDDVPEHAFFRELRPGMLVDVRIEKALPHSLWGAPEGAASPAPKIPGGFHHVA